MQARSLGKLSKRDRRRVLRRARSRTWMIRTIRGKAARSLMRRMMRKMTVIGTWTIPELCMDMTVVMGKSG